jgi:hypothetical protein
MQKFITEQSLLKEVRKLIHSSDDARLAVAYWGRDAMVSLRLKSPAKIRLICDLNSGACNPHEIALIKAQKYDILTLDDLHAKVYWTPKGVIVGSSNASAGGYTTLDKKQANFEANLFTDDPKIVKEIGSWFEEGWARSKTITKNMICAAKKKYQDRPPRPPGSTLLTAFRAAPEFFSGKRINVVIYERHSSKEAKDALTKWNAAERARAQSLNNDPPSNWLYERMDLPPSSWFISCYKGRANYTIDGVVRTSDPVSKLIVQYDDGPEWQQLAVRAKKWTIDLGRSGQYYLSPAERAKIQAALPTITRSRSPEDGDWWCLPLADALPFID